MPGGWPPEPAAPADARDLFVHAVLGLGAPAFEVAVSASLGRTLG